MIDNGYNVEWYIAQLKQDIEGIEDAYKKERIDNKLYMLNDLLKDIIAEILLEYNHARKKHPSYPDDIIHQIAIITEESGEAMQAALQLVYENDSSSDKVYKEVIQIAALCIRFLINFKK